MANFKRRRCRLNCPKAIRGSQASWRAKHGFKPVRIRTPEYTAERQASRKAWDQAWQEWRAAWHHPEGKDMMRSYPAHWDRRYHTRPKRARTHMLEKLVLRGQLDEGNIAWPLGNSRPHKYYW